MADSASMAAGEAPARPICPRCSGAVGRVPRHVADRLISLLVPVRRYRCRAMGCRWEGTLRDECFDLAPGDSSKHYNRRL